MAGDPCVDCGTDSVATCQRCQQRKCGAHYLVAAGSMTDGTLTGTQPSGRVVTLFAPDGWSKRARMSYARGGAGCTSCRTRDAEQENEQFFKDFSALCDRVVEAPSAAGLLELYDAMASGNPVPDISEDITRALANAFRLIKASHQIIEVRTAVSGTFRKGVRVNVLSRTPALQFVGMRPSGDSIPTWALTGDGALYKVDGRGGKLFIVPEGRTPSFRHYKASSYGGFDSPAGNLLDTRSEYGGGIKAVSPIFLAYQLEAVRDLAKSGALP